MTTDFLMGFSRSLVAQLVAEEQLEVSTHVDSVVVYLASRLGSLGEGKSLLSSVERALLDCPDVDEIYFDLDGLKEIVEGLGPR